MTLSNNIRLAVSSTLTGTVGNASVTATIREAVTSTLSGTDALFTASGDQTGTEDVYDLADATVSDPLGDSVTFASVGLVYFRNRSENVIVLGGGTDDIAPLATGESVPAGGVVIRNATYTVGVGADQITVNGTAGDAYDLIVIGTKPT